MENVRWTIIGDSYRQKGTHIALLSTTFAAWTCLGVPHRCCIQDTAQSREKKKGGRKWAIPKRESRAQEAQLSVALRLSLTQKNSKGMRDSTTSTASLARCAVERGHQVTLNDVVILTFGCSATRIDAPPPPRLLCVVLKCRRERKHSTPSHPSRARGPQTRAPIASDARWRADRP